MNAQVSKKTSGTLACTSNSVTSRTGPVIILSSGEAMHWILGSVLGPSLQDTEWGAGAWPEGETGAQGWWEEAAVAVWLLLPHGSRLWTCPVHRNQKWTKATSFCPDSPTTTWINAISLMALCFSLNAHLSLLTRTLPSLAPHKLV